MSNTNAPGQPGQYPNPGQYAAPPAPKKKRRWILWTIIAAVLILIIVGMASCISAMNSALAPTPGVVVSESTEPEGKSKAPEASKPAVPPSDDEPYTIKATECKRGDYGQVDIKVKVTNNTDQKRTYIFDISVEDTEGNVVGSGAGSISGVNPGKTGTAGTFASMTDDEYDGKIKCVVEVTNFTEAN